MSSFRDLVKKVNAEKTAGTSERKSSSFRDLVTKVNDGTIKVYSNLNGSQVNDWYKGVKTFSEMGYKYLTSEGYKTPNTSILNNIDDYLSQAAEVGMYIRSNRDAYEDYDKVMQDYNDTVNYLRSLKSGINSSNKFFSDFKDEEDYNFWDDHSTVENRQAWYQEQQNLVDELGEVYDNYYNIDLLYDDYKVNPASYTPEEAKDIIAKYEKNKEYKQKYGSDRGILEAIDAAKAEMENYKRGNYNENGRFYGSKVVDDNYAVTQNADFAITSANRDYINPSKEDIDIADIMNDPDEWKNGSDGVLRDAFGNELAIDGNNTYYNPNPVAQGTKVQDKLALFLGTPEADRVQYAIQPVRDGIWTSVMQSGYEGAWEYLTDQEVGIYYTYLGESQERADQYLSDMEVELNRRRTLDEIGQWHDGYEDANFLEKIALSVATVPAKFVGSVGGTIDNIAHTLKGEDINPYSTSHSGMHFSQTIRGDRAAELDKTGLKLPGIDFTLGDLYQTGMSRMDSALATTVFGGGGTVFLGMGAAQEEAYKLYQQGASAEQITLGSFAAGAAEAIWEYVSYGKLKEIEEIGSPGDWVKSVLVQGVNELKEEARTEISNIISNALIMGSQSDLAELYKENNANAFNTFLDLVKQTAHAAFGGFVGGAMAGGVQGGVSYFDTQAQYAEAGEKINDSAGGEEALRKLSKEVAGVSDAKMQKMLNKHIAAVEKKASDRNVGRLRKTLGDAYNAQNKADIVTILEMNKFDSKQANDIADAVVALATGNLTEQQADLLELYKDNENVKGVIAGYDFDERSTIGKRNLAMYNFDYGVAFSAEAKKYADKVFTPDGKYKVSSDGEAKALVTEEVDGKTITKDTGEVIDIKRIKEIRKTEVGNKTKIELILDIGDGKEINAENVAYATKNDALIYEAIAKLGDNIDADTANKLISKFDGGNAMVFARGMTQAYTYGFYGLDRSEMKGKHTLSAELTNEQRNFAYELGEKYRPVKDQTDKKEAKVIKAPGEKGVYYRDKNGNATDIRTYLDKTKIGLKDVQKTAIEVMEEMSEMLGVRFNVFESWVENGERYYLNQHGKVTKGNPNGFYDTATGEIYIDLNAGQDYQGTMLFTVAHELTHFMRQWSPEQFTKIANIVFKHGGMKGSVAKLAAVKQAKARKKGEPISYDTALEEVVADGMETILKDGKVLEFMEDVKKTDHEAWAKLKEWFQKLADFLKKLVDVYGSHSAQTVEGAKVAEFAEDLLTQIKQLYAVGAVTAGENYQMAIGKVKVSNQITMEEDVIDSSNTGIAKEAKAGIRMQERTEFEAQPKQVFRVSTVNGKAESNMLGTNKSVKELRDANFKENGFSKEEIDKINGFIKEMADNMTKYRLKYKFIGLQNIHDAKIILDPMSGKIVLSAMVNNSDYSVNFDFTKICKKRVALQEVLETLAREKGKVTDGNVTEVNLTPANIKHINDILASYGVETACLCCFVESKRYNIQNYYQEKVVDVWNALVDEVAPDASYFNFADSDVDTSKIPDSEFADLEMQMKEWAGKTGKAKDVEQKMREFLADAPAARKKLRFSDLVTANGRTNLHKLYPEIESLILSKLGQSAPKSVEAFTPYNGEIDLLEATNNGDIIKYLYSIAGVRSQSFSDFMIAHVFDVLQKTASMSARKMPAHVYTKEIARAMLFGMTGEKHNMSVLHNVDPNVDSWSAGLSADGEYNFSDYEAYKKGYSEFVQSIGWKDAVTLQNTEGYSKDCGIIGVGFSYNHMLKLHNDPEVRQVIGYHTSQMPVEVKPLTHLDKAADYTGVQNTKAFAGFAKPNYAIPEGVPSYATPPQDIMPKGDKKKTPKTTAVSDTFDIVGTFNKLSKGKTGDARTAAAKETLRQLLEYANDHGYVIKTASGEKGKGEFDLYGDVQKTENPYLTTDHYIEYCIERGFLPMFFEFSMNPNYYKDIFDFNVFDRKSYNPETGLHEDSEGRKAYAPQTAVHMLNEDGSLAFPENFFDIVDKQMNSYNSYMQDVDSKMPSIMDEVRAVTNSTTKMSERNFKNDQNAKGEFVANILIDLGDMNSKWWTGKYNHAIFGMSKTDDTEFRQFYQELLKRTKDMDDYGEGDNQIVFDAFKVQDGKGNEFIYRVALDGYLHGVVVAKINLARYKAYVKKYGRSNNHGRTPANTIRRVGTARANLGSNGSGSIGSKQPNGNPGSSGVVGASPQGNITGNDSGGNSPNPKVPDVTSHDSDGNQLSAEQQKFFKRSVVRDADGRLMVMYHGTANGGAFTIFEGDKLGNRTLTSQIGQGFYFTNVKKEAESYMKNVDIYGRVSNGKSPYLHQVYLNITNPFDVNADTLDIDKVKSVYMDGTSDHFFDSYISHYLNNKTVNGRVFTKAEVQGMSKADRVSLYVDYLAQIGTKELLSNMVQAFKFNEQSQLLASMKNRLGYDGIVEEFKPGQFQYVAFSSEQIKNVDNQNPTTDPDIRYSDRVLMGSLFSGGGTLEAGLAYQMLDKQFGVEYDGKIASVYADNHGDHIQVGRVEDFDISKYDDIFYLHASPVCHNFSAAKHGAKELAMDIASARATAKHLETAMPQVFTVENAPGYLKSKSLKIITDKLTELGYKWDADIYNSADYGSATSRNRVILRAVKDGELPAKPTKQDRTNSWDKVTRDLWDTLPKATLRPSFISAIENTRNLPILDANGKVNVNKPLLILTTTSGHTVTYCWEGDICPTLTTKCGEARLVMPDGNIYAVTPEFMGRIQGLPNDYKYPKEKTRAFTIIGNGIPTHLTKAVVGGVLDSAYEQTHDGQALYQDRDTDSVSNRSLLANAFEGLAQNDAERNKIQEYRSKVALINEEERKLRDLNTQIKELSFSEGPRDTKKIKGLRFDAAQVANRINTYDKQLLRLEASKPLQDVLNREKRKAYKKAEERGKEALAEYKSRVEAKQMETAEKWRKSRKAAVAKARETADKREAREKLQKLVLDTVKWITYPTKTDVKCPDILKQPYADFLNGIDLSSKRLENGGDPTKNDLRLANAMGSLATALDRIMTAQDPSQDSDKVLDTGYLDLPADFVQKLRDMTESIKAMMVEGDYVVNNMTAAEVRQLSQMIRTLNHAIKTMSNLYANLRFANIEELGFDTMEFMDALGEIEKTGGMKDFVEWDNALPYYAFKRFGKGGESVFEGLMDAQDKLAFLAKVIFDFQEKTWTGNEAKAWSEDTHTITLPNGNELTLTTADAMSIYCLSRRDQGLQHLLGGGTRVMGIKKGSQKAKDSRSLLTIEDISAIISSLSDRQKQVAEAMQEFMSTVCSEWGNEISMKRFLTKEFTEKFYFPIESNDENLPTKDPAAQQSDLFRLLNISATKPLTPGANNEVIIRNIFDVFTGHASDMARLNAYGMALLDYMKWLNYREKTANEEGQLNVRGVRKSMEKAYGNAAKSYVLNLVKDVNGRPSDGGDPNILMKWMRAAKTASVGSSLRVATLQITSYPRAALVLSPKSLTLGLSKKPQIEKAKKYCGIALWKSFGFYDTNISRSIEDQMKGVKDIKQKLIELSLKGAELGDAITWGALWNACEYEVAQTTKNKIGSEEFYQEVANKLREVVYKTQVVDSTLTRSQIMRSKRGMAQEAAAFMSEPTLSANILMDAGFEFNAEKRRTGSAKAAWNKTGKYIGRAVAVYAIGQLTAALLEGLWDAWRDDDDDEFGEKYLDAFIENLVLDIAPFNKIPIVSDVFEAVLALFDVGFYSSDKMSTTWLTQTVSAVDAWKDALSGESSVTVYNALYKTTRAISSFFGVSVSGVMREAVALWNNTAGAYDLTLKILTYDRTEEELGELLLDAFLKGNTRQAESLKAEFEEEDDYKKAIRKAVKNRYEAGDIDDDTAKQYLVKYAGMPEDKAYWKVQEWEYKTDTGGDFQKFNNFYEAVKTGKNLKAVIKEYTDNGVDSKALASQITSYFKPLYKEMSNVERASIKGYLLNAYALLGYDRSKKSKDIDKWVED